METYRTFKRFILCTFFFNVILMEIPKNSFIGKLSIQQSLFGIKTLFTKSQFVWQQNMWPLNVQNVNFLLNQSAHNIFFLNSFIVYREILFILFHVLCTWIFHPPIFSFNRIYKSRYLQLWEKIFRTHCFYICKNCVGNWVCKDCV